MTTFTTVTDNVDYPQATHINQFATELQTMSLPMGTVTNGKISVTVTSNNITVALKTLSGSDPSTSEPVGVWINGTKRQCTAALSVTKNAGTNWFDSGSSELATKEVDYFAYLIWNTTGTDIMDIGFARIPTGRVYSDFSGTTTNAKYLAFGNASTPTSTDDVVLIGRFAATLSASASYNWSVPTYTNLNLIQHPIYQTRKLSWTPAHSRTGGAYTNAPTVNEVYYQINGDRLSIHEYHTQNATPGSSGQQTLTLPFSNPLLAQSCIVSNGTTGVVLNGFWTTTTKTMTIYKYDGTAEATASNIYIVDGEFYL